MAKSRMVSLLEGLTYQEGPQPSALPGVNLMRMSKYVKTPVVYEPSIVILAQGRKIGYVGERVYTYDANNYLVLSVPLPFECETFATPGEPLLGLSISVTPGMLGELLLEMDAPSPSVETISGIYATPLTEELTGAGVRLLEALRSQADSRILGPQIVREITYRVLCGEQSGALRAVATRQGHFAQIGKVLRRIHENYAESFQIEDMAREASMSVTLFHQNFRAVTSTTPLQYVKTIRLHKARLLMAQQGVNASVAARSVGYESASQFSREFKRFFGDTPTEEAARVRAYLA
ncbi:AraC family transcriptional regulator [Pendulispora brunnea]|uniref:AraC family transcriptional regulator n=1 Tax=Pendulispora brunnea TaxID=2905690 RepID=A0ABZ2KKN6_9BACT